MKRQPKIGKDALTGLGYLYKVKTHAAYGKQDFKHEDAYSESFRYKEVQSKFKYTNLMPNFKYKDSDIIIEVFADIDFQIGDKIETKDGLSGVIQNEPIVTKEPALNGISTRKKWVISFG